jgi:hypothetical protein
MFLNYIKEEFFFLIKNWNIIIALQNIESERRKIKKNIYTYSKSKLSEKKWMQKKNKENILINYKKKNINSLPKKKKKKLKEIRIKYILFK